MTQAHPSTVKDAGVWLKRLENLSQPGRALSQHEEELFWAVNSALNKELSFYDGYKLLIQVYPHFALVRGHVERWSPLLMDALVGTLGLRDNEMLVHLLTLMGDTYMLTSKATAAYEAFDKALRRAQEEQTPERMLSVYIGIIKLQQQPVQ
jgi:hypothetical protein